MEIAPNVHWIDAGSVNLYLFADADGWTLVDAGMPRRQHLVFDTLTALGQQPSDLKRILITHADVDHAGGMAAIQAESGAVVITSQEAKPYLLSGKSPDHLPKITQVIVNLLFKYKPVASQNIQLVADGDILPYLGGLHVIQSFGHTLDHYSFYSPSTGILFAGDALNTREGRINSSPASITADKTLATRSAIKLLDLAPTTLACGHGRPSSSFSADDITTLINKLRQENK